MLTGQRIEAARAHAGIPIYIMCNAMDLLTESEYKTIVGNNKKLTVCQQIMIFTLFESYPESLSQLYE